MAEAIRDGLRLEAIAADIAGDGDTALELLSVNAYTIAVLDRDIPGPTGDDIAKRIVASGSGMPVLVLTAPDRLDDKASGFELGADDYLTKPFELRGLVLRLRALDLRRAHNTPPVREIARSAGGSVQAPPVSIPSQTVSRESFHGCRYQLVGQRGIGSREAALRRRSKAQLVGGRCRRRQVTQVTQCCEGGPAQPTLHIERGSCARSTCVSARPCLLPSERPGEASHRPIWRYTTRSEAASDEQGRDARARRNGQAHRSDALAWPTVRESDDEQSGIVRGFEDAFLAGANEDWLRDDPDHLL